MSDPSFSEFIKKHVEHEELLCQSAKWLQYKKNNNFLVIMSIREPSLLIQLDFPGEKHTILPENKN